MIHINNIDTIIKLLEDRFENKLPMSSKTEFELGKLVGNQEVVEFLKEVKARQEYNSKKK